MAAMRWVNRAMAVAAMVAAAGSASAQVGASISVTVRDAEGRPVANAIVCAGTANDRGAFDIDVTNSNGSATLRLPAETVDIPVNGGPTTSGRLGTIIVTGSFAGRGNEAALLAPQSIAMLRLWAKGGPACPADARAAPTPGNFTVDRAAIDRFLAASAARARAQPGYESPVLNRPPRGRRCFGAVGQNCGDVIPELSTCNPINRECLVNAGSWRHDECCVANPTGGSCENATEAVTQVAGAQICQDKFNLAAARLATPLTWKRRVDFARVNTGSTVEHAAYCAPAGTLMPRDERAFCCSGNVRAPNGIERVSIAFGYAGVPADRINICS